MSVPSWRRSLSKTEYIHKAFKLAEYIGQIVANKPKKYKQNYGDTLIKTSLECIKHCQIANGIYIHKDMSKSDFALRRQHLFEARGCVDHVSTVAYIFLELSRKSDGANFEKLYDQENRIGQMCSEIHNLITGVIKSDSERIK